MKYPTRIYAKALAESVFTADASHAEKIRHNFLELVRFYGDEAHLPKILEETERLLRAKNGTKKFTVRVARAQKKSAREFVKNLIGPNDAVEEVVDSSLVAGMKVVVNDEMVFDGSLRSKLDKLFAI
jgi:F0F1-type ATP synthase delta subunit